MPVVAARAGSIPEVAGDAALLVEPTDDRGLAEALDRVLTDDATASELDRARPRPARRVLVAGDRARRSRRCYRRLAGRR